MGTFFWFATGLGFIAGLAHAVNILATQWRLPGADAKAMAMYRAAWAVVLWTLFGSYLVALWIVGLVLKPLIGRNRATA